MPRTISDATTRLPDKPTVSDDLIRHYQLRPIPGQLTLTTCTCDPLIWTRAPSGERRLTPSYPA